MTPNTHIKYNIIIASVIITNNQFPMLIIGELLKTEPEPIIYQHNIYLPQNLSTIINISRMDLEP